MEKFLIILLSIMLVVLLVFNVFGIAYNENNFFDTILTVEHGLGKVSNTILTTYERLKELFPIIYDSTTSLYELTLGKFFSWIQEQTGLDIIDFLIEPLRSITNFVKDISLHLEFYSKYGFSVFDNSWWKEYNFFMVQIYNPDMYEDFSIRRGFDWNKFHLYMQAFLYGAQNQYSYLLQAQVGTNVLNYVDVNEPSETWFFRLSYFAINYPTETKFDYYLTTIDTVIPSTYMPHLSITERALSYLGGVVLPVFDTNIDYVDSNNKTYMLKAIAVDGSSVGTLSNIYSFGFYDMVMDVDFVFQATDGSEHTMHYYEWAKNYAQPSTFKRLTHKRFDFVYTPSTP